MFSLIRILGLTGLLKLVGKLMLDRRVPLRFKLIIGAGLVYLISPIDPVPDFIPAVGHIDDLLVMILAVAAFLVMAPRDVVLELYRGRGAAAAEQAPVIDADYRYVDEEPEAPK